MPDLLLGKTMTDPNQQILPDARGYFGRFGGVFVPEVLVEALTRLDEAIREAFADPAFWSEYEGLLRAYVGRPSPIYHAERLVRWPARTDLAADTNLCDNAITISNLS
jgi:tryptophan synthase beta subunit